MVIGVVCYLPLEGLHLLLCLGQIGGEPHDGVLSVCLLALFLIKLPLKGADLPSSIATLPTKPLLHLAGHVPLLVHPLGRHGSLADLLLRREPCVPLLLNLGHEVQNSLAQGVGLPGQFIPLLLNLRGIFLNRPRPLR